MAVKFIEDIHKYVSVNPSEDIQWTSVTTIIGKYKEPFNGSAVAAKVSKKKTSKWYGMTPEKIQEVWKSESDRACTMGTFYHNRREEELFACETIERVGEKLDVIRYELDENGFKLAGSQRVKPGIYPEFLVYSKKYAISGQVDLAEIYGGKIHITDYKTNKEIKDRSFRNWDGVYKKMKSPVSHIEDCNLNHYTLQLSLYMYLMLKHNPQLRPGNLTIHHVTFEKEEDDEYGFPKHVLEEDGSPIVKSVQIYNLPYLKEEVRAILEHSKQQRK